MSAEAAVWRWITCSTVLDYQMLPEEINSRRNILQLRTESV